MKRLSLPVVMPVNCGRRSIRPLIVIVSSERIASGLSPVATSVLCKSKLSKTNTAVFVPGATKPTYVVDPTVIVGDEVLVSTVTGVVATRSPSVDDA
jgi:hypothetical protein